MRILMLLLTIGLLLGCGNKTKAPDVSHIKVDVKLERFEKDLFHIDTLDMDKSLHQLQEKYPTFTNDFLFEVLGADPRWNKDTLGRYLTTFMNFYRPLYKETDKMFDNFDKYQDQITQGLKYVRYHFPEYAIPSKIITYVGPVDGYGDILSDDILAVGLHHHLGEDYALYQEPWVIETYPQYISKRFTPNTIAVNAMKNIVMEMFPEQFEEFPLIVQMVEKGKRLYVLQQLLPKTEEHLLIGYTEKQLKECYQYEKMIWNLFTQNNYLQQSDFNIVKNYIGEGPRTMELGEDSPGNIGSFAGWQIVKKYMSKYPETTLKELMDKNAEEIHTLAKYKP